jgi:hypothetical protein
MLRGRHRPYAYTVIGMLERFRESSPIADEIDAAMVEVRSGPPGTIHALGLTARSNRGERHNYARWWATGKLQTGTVLDPVPTVSKRAMRDLLLRYKDACERDWGTEMARQVEAGTIDVALAVGLARCTPESWASYVSHGGPIT